MPTPEDTFQVIKTQLEAVGIKITPVAAKWTPDYLDMAQGEKGTDKRDIHLLGWTGDYDDPDNFLGVFFAAKSNEWGFDNPELFAALKAARELPTVEEQKPRTRRSTRRSSTSAGRADRAPGADAGVRRRGGGLRAQPGAGRGLEHGHGRVTAGRTRGPAGRTSHDPRRTHAAGSSSVGCCCWCRCCSG